MKIAVAGAHGQIARHLIPILVEHGDEVIGLIRNPDHAAELREAGAEAVLCDLERAGVDEVRDAVAGCEAAVFAAGAGAGSGPQRKWTMDRDGAVKLIEATAPAGSRYVMVSAVGAEDPPAGDEVFAVYLRAKAEADAALAATDRDWVILRPGRLTDESARGRVRLDTEPFRGEVSRADVAAVIAALLAPGAPSRVIAYLSGGEVPVADAVRSLT